MRHGYSEMVFLRMACCCIVAWVHFMPHTAQAEDDTALWMVTNINKKFDDQISANLEGQWRFVNHGASFSQRLIRPSISYALNDRVTLTAGYVHVLTNPNGRDSFTENRPWQQVGYTLYKNDYGTSISGRSRIEERFVENGDDMGWRFRQFFRLDVPIEKQHSTRAVYWNEVFLGLNDTDWGQRSAWDQTRNFAGISFPVTDTIRMEAGYLHQFINRRKDNLTNHALATYLNFSF